MLIQCWANCFVSGEWVLRRNSLAASASLNFGQTVPLQHSQPARIIGPNNNKKSKQLQLNYESTSIPSRIYDEKSIRFPLDCCLAKDFFVSEHAARSENLHSILDELFWFLICLVFSFRINHVEMNKTLHSFWVIHYKGYD